MPARKRALTALAVGALLAPLTPFATPASANHVEIRSIDLACPEGQVGDPGYTDVPEGNLFERAIACISDYDIAKGKTTTQYAPAQEVLRRQMALFIYRLGVLAGYDFDTTTDPGFTDDDQLDAETRRAIWGLANADIVQGETETRYAPNKSVTRAQMASFLARSADVLGVEGFTPARDYFVDDEDSVHENNINAIAAEGITGGSRYGDQLYAPRENVTRQQMAAFLARMLDILVEQDLVDSVYGISVAPDDKVTLTAVPNPDSQTSDNRTYTVDGLEAGEEYRVTLFLESKVTRNSAGEDVFAEQGTSNVADTGNPTADIVTVNGTAQTNPGNTAVFTAGSTGSATFVVDGDQAESVLPVVHPVGGSGQTAEQGGPTAGLDLNADNTAAEEYDRGGVTVYTATPVTGATDAPDLLSVKFERTTGTAPNQVTTVRYTFDEPVVSAVDVTGFHLYSFDGTQIDPRDGTDLDTDPDAGSAARALDDEKSVVVVFDVNPDEFAAVTLATVDRGAVEDSDGNQNPIGDAPLNSGVKLAGGSTAAPDLVEVKGPVENGGEGAARRTRVDFVFDEEAFVVTANAFRLVALDGSVIQCAAVLNPDGGDQGNYLGDGSKIIKADCPLEDVDDATATAIYEIADIARGVVLENAVSDADPTTGAGTPSGTEGNRNPLEATTTPDANTGTTSSPVPDLVSVTLDPPNDRATFTFDTPVVLAPEDVAGQFHLYDADGDQINGTAATQETTPDTTIVVTFTEVELARGGSVGTGAVKASGTGGKPNAADEVGTSPTVAAGKTAGPDLLSVSREVVTETNPLTGEETATDVAISFVFDEEVDVQGDQFNGFDFFVVEPDSTATELVGCTAAAGSSTVKCTVSVNDNPLTSANEANIAAAALEAVLGTVDDGAVADDETVANPEGASTITQK